VPDSVGASVGVTGAVLGMSGGPDGGFDPWGGGIADIDTQVSQSTAQSQISPSA
jgi:hypothetical protein